MRWRQWARRTTLAASFVAAATMSLGTAQEEFQQGWQRWWHLHGVFSDFLFGGEHLCSPCGGLWPERSWHHAVLDRTCAAISPKVFRFGNGQTQTSDSFVLIPQTLGKHHISLGAFTIDAPGVPLLLGIRSLDKLGAIVDCSRSVVVLKKVDAALMIP